MTLKAEKIAGIIRKETSEIIQSPLKGPKIGFITITDVMVTNDLSIAKIYVPFLGQKPGEEAGMKALDRSRGYPRNKLVKRMMIRKVSEPTFELNDSLERGNKIKHIISKINK